MYNKRELIGYIATAFAENINLVDAAMDAMEMRLPLSQTAVYDVLVGAIADYCTDNDTTTDEIYDNEEDWELFYDAIQIL